MAHNHSFISTMVNTYPMSDGAISRNGNTQHNGTVKQSLVIPPDLLADLEYVDRTMVERVNSHAALINVAGRYILRSGGKRLRAMLALLAAQLGTYQLEQVVHSAAAVELIHVASLVHDDLVDEAERRRGVRSVHAEWDGGVALMVGDYFFAMASKEMSLAPDPRIITYFSDAVMSICEGELSPVMAVVPSDTAREQYYTKIGCKTASLFAAACKAGMASGGGTLEQIDALGNFGYDLGLAFQIVDDMLDFTGDAERLGKPAGSDLRNGVITLPLIYTVALSPEQSNTRDMLIKSTDSHDDALVQWAVQEVQRVGIEPTRQEAYTIINRALHHLELFPQSPARDMLANIAAFVIERDL